MSGGHWGYMQHRLRDFAHPFDPSIRTLVFEALADAEKIVDWAVCCDTSRRGAESELFTRMTRLFDDLSEHL